MQNIRIGTRGSALALQQAHQVKNAFIQQGIDDHNIQIIIINTSGDKMLEARLSNFGGKGLFTKEIEEALLANQIDLAVHSTKDMPTKLSDGLEIISYLEREDVRDAFISDKYNSLDELPENSIFGTASLRRQAQLLQHYPHLNMQLLRGNVQTRLKKIESGGFDATLLAYAGLKRLNLTHFAKQILPIESYLPAPAQGAICIEIVGQLNDDLKQLILNLNHEPTSKSVITERLFLQTIEGSCRLPIAAYAVDDNRQCHFRAEILSIDGKIKYHTEYFCDWNDANNMAIQAAINLKTQAGENFFNVS
jgi:hydroxymethylbilane synthase